jgi:hypothetical protein
LRAATVAAEAWGDLAPLARITVDRKTAVRHRLAAAETLTDIVQGALPPEAARIQHHQAGSRNTDLAISPESLRAQTVELATDADTPAILRVHVAARLLPAEQARTILGDIADTRDTFWGGARSAAIERLAEIDRRAAAEALGRLIRDDHLPRLRRWWIINELSELLPAEEYGILDDRLEAAEDGGFWLWAVRMARLVVSPPERVFGPLPPLTG